MQHSKTHPTRVGTRFDSKISLTKLSIFCLTPKCLWDPDRNAFLDELFPTVLICKTLFFLDFWGLGKIFFDPSRRGGVSDLRLAESRPRELCSKWAPV